MKTRSNANRGMFFVVLGVWLLSVLACSRGYVSADELGGVVQPLPSQPAVQPTGAIGGGEPILPTAQTPAPTLAVTDPPTPTPGPTNTPTPTVTPSITNTPRPPTVYLTIPGDTLKGLAARFGVQPDQIQSSTSLPQSAFLPPNLTLLIPDLLDETSAGNIILPDSEVIYSPSATDFNIPESIAKFGGYLSGYQEYLNSGWATGAEIVQRVANENSINPRLLLALLEYRTQWVTGQPKNIAEREYPLGYIKLESKGLYLQLTWAVQQISTGYYGWRSGAVTNLAFPDGSTLRINPRTNAGSAAMQYLFAHFMNRVEWNGALYGTESITALYERLFGNPYLRAQAVEPLIPGELSQPPLALPFRVGQSWSMTGGPHSAWGRDGAFAALDFAPGTTEKGCYNSTNWVTASAGGVVVRSGNGVVTLDLDGDGSEQTGWVLLYLHIASEDRIPAGSLVTQDDRLGHPSCEGGQATGTHVHMARKYNGEWMLADGPVSFNLSGWIAHAGKEAYQGTLTRDGAMVTGSLVGAAESMVTRTE